MLSAQNMGSHGHQSLPFGYDHNEIQGIGLPAYINQPPPPGRPLLSEQENDQMQDFFSSIAGDGQAQGHQFAPEQFQPHLAQMNEMPMPNAYVGHETFLGSPQALEWHPRQMSDFHMGHVMNQMQPMHTPTSPFGPNGHVLSQTSPIFPAHPHNAMQSFTNAWQQPYPSHPGHTHRIDMQFGTDPHFSNTGYAAPHPPMEAPLSLISYAIAPTNSTAPNSAANSASNSNPGSNANTEPSSPVANKKRKLNAFQTDALRMTTMNGAHGSVSPPKGSRKPRKSFVKDERPPTPISKTPTMYEDEEDADPEEDAEYDDDEDGAQQHSPTSLWPASKARSAHRPTAPSKHSKQRKKSTAGADGKSRARKQSTGLLNANARVPLTAEQKKANHTNSEQRRRDATSRAYADLYDMVPEIEEGGKQSTMKKMGIVVGKVQNVTERLRYLRQITGKNLDTGISIPTRIPQHQYGGELSHLSTW